MKTAIYPGSFDPVTNGHIDIIERASSMFDRLIVAVAYNSSKKGLFSIDERVELLQAVTADMEHVRISSFEGLLVDYCQKEGAVAVIRGLRAVSDFDYEYAMFQMNRLYNENTDTVFLLASQKYSHLSSSIIKEFARYGRSVKTFTPEIVNKALLKKFGHVEPKD